MIYRESLPGSRKILSYLKTSNRGLSCIKDFDHRFCIRILTWLICTYSFCAAETEIIFMIFPTILIPAKSSCSIAVTSTCNPAL